MIHQFQLAFATYQAYVGSSIIYMLSLCCVVYLFFREERKEIRAILVYGTMILFSLFLFPLFAYIMINVIFDNEVYYRFLWLLPSYIVLAYTAVRFLDDIKSKKKRCILGVVLMAGIMLNGDYVYQNPSFSRAENPYHIPQNIVNVCNVIMPEEGEEWVSIVAPKEMISYVRQYSAEIHMPYGRAVLIERWSMGHPLYELMEEDTLDVYALCEMARQYGCHYIVIPESKSLNGSFEESNFLLVQSVDGYLIYLDQYNNRDITLDGL